MYSTFPGGVGIESAANDFRGSDIVVNNQGQAYVSGITTSPNFPVVNGYDMSYDSGDDGFISFLSADGSSLLCSTFMGGEANDYKKLGLAIDLSGMQDTLYASITTHSLSTFDGGNFSVVQTQGPVGIIEGAGNNSSMLRYSYSDHYVRPGIVHYKIEADRS